MDLDAYVAEHASEWARLEQLVRRRRLSAAEADELITLYQRTATHLSAVQSRTPDPALIGRLSRLVSRARAAVAGSSAPAWRSVLSFFTVTFPAAVYQAWRWWSTIAVTSSVVAFALIAYIGAHPSLAAKLGTDEQLRHLVDHDFADYYSEYAAQNFALKVWTNNALVAAICLISGIVLLPVVYMLYQNIVGVGVTGGVMVAFGRSDVFFGLITPHGLLELTAVFVAAGVGMRMGWSWISPPPTVPRGQALGAAMRSAVMVALGLVVVLMISGVIEAFVTPSSLPTWARVGIGVLAFSGFLFYVVFFGRRAVRRGYTGDLDSHLRGDYTPTA
ncbi:MAG: rane protein [Actinomycetia bacterium]|nr:rane protein [Actinomycetes bacterium]MDQ1645960.1 hypothetical protein [Cryptosporangiaceae bacterium]MDQ1657828.1 hypothetical protein [Cryptosporangiaceae bacterium]